MLDRIIGEDEACPVTPDTMIPANRLQSHTVRIYRLEEHAVTEEVSSARQLLSPLRFDLFAKLYYIRNRRQNRQNALKVYKEHIKAFNPDLQEPGRCDKVGYEDFISSFDRLIDYFEANEFDPSLSLVPVTDDNVILDGAHRVAALAYYDKNVGIARCHGVVPKANFDYVYFKNRGLSWDVMDLTANEMVHYLPYVYVACVWPKVSDKSIAMLLIRKQFEIVYERSFKVTYASLSKLIAEVYKNQSWTRNPDSLTDKTLQCFGFDKEITFIFFVADNLQDVQFVKESIRSMYGFGKHSVHITDNMDESQAISECVLVAGERRKWQIQSMTGTLLTKLSERWFYFKRVQLINFKVSVARLLRIGR